MPAMFYNNMFIPHHEKQCINISMCYVKAAEPLLSYTHGVTISALVYSCNKLIAVWYMHFHSMSVIVLPVFEFYLRC